MTTRRQFLTVSAAAAAAGLLPPGLAWAQPATAPMQTRKIPSSGEALPVIGMGTSGSFQVGETPAERDPLREVLRRFFAGGGTVIDTAPSYGTAETVMGDLLAELGLTGKAWLATKLSGVNGREAGLAQFSASLGRLKTDKVALLAVHNLGDWKTQFEVIKQLKAEGKVRYSGLTHYLESGQDALVEVVKATRPDFLQINYSVSTRGAEKTVFPVAQELGVAVMINRAFDDGKLFARVKDKPLPAWAAEAGIGSWAQAFLKFALSHPAVTVVIPATGKPDRQSDNLKAGDGPTLTQAQREDLITLIG
ncbi:aldo/keto reductase [Dokdonella koreensis]|uniref:Aldo/keto reductase n=1 Tax=Dokdonella koreensis DS-123 TaxID=1300342 RepID=A0A160DVF4_9GAMM|nr:aldo/keto reductase [Dokdonella koreensis]ANB17753.1 Aldo/keto reductase precursor [Dokdonella koreensis DS-123]